MWEENMKSHYVTAQSKWPWRVFQFPSLRDRNINERSPVLTSRHHRVVLDTHANVSLGDIFQCWTYLWGDDTCHSNSEEDPALGYEGPTACASHLPCGSPRCLPRLSWRLIITEGRHPALCRAEIFHILLIIYKVNRSTGSDPSLG